jgi:multimeric flavodoxin WrbA
MKKVTAFVGSAHKRNTHKAVVLFLDKLQAMGDVEVEIVTLSDHKLGFCRGCRVCFDKGEEFCPLKDDRDVLMAKIDASDGVVFATPNYAWGMSGMMKAFVDRFGAALHRPRYFGRSFTSIVTQGISRGNRIVEDLDWLGTTLGFNTVKGACVTAFDPPSEREQRKIDKALTALSLRFYTSLTKQAYPEPSWLMLMGFRMGRTSIRQTLDDRSRDYRYYAEKGWFESDYFYPTPLSLPKKAAGKLFDRMGPALRNMMA